MGRKFKNIFSMGHWQPLICRLPGNEQRIALSFDDGPTPTTTLALINLLSRYNAKATFFLTGERASAHPELVEALVRGGHDIYGHSWEHIRLDQAGPGRMTEEFQKTEDLLRLFRPTPSPYLIRLPYGAGSRVPWVHQLVHSWNPTNQIAHWSHSMKDWDIAMSCPDMEELNNRCEKTVQTLLQTRRLNGAILLLHESAYDRIAPLTPYVAPVLVEKILKEFSARDFKFMPIQPHTHQSWFSRFILL